MNGSGPKLPPNSAWAHVIPAANTTPLVGCIIEGTRVEVTGRMVLGSSFLRCLLIADEAIPLPTGISNVFNGCHFVGAGWPDYVRQLETWTLHERDTKWRASAEDAPAQVASAPRSPKVETQAEWAKDAAERIIERFGDAAAIDTANYALRGFILAAARVAAELPEVAARIGARMEPKRKAVPSRQPLVLNPGVGNVYNLTDLTIAGQTFNHCQLILTAPNPDLLTSGNTFVGCLFIGDGWPHSVKATGMWRATL